MLRDEIFKRTRIDLKIASEVPIDGKPAILLGTAEVLSKHGISVPKGLKLPNKIDGYALWTSVEEGGQKFVYLAGHDERGVLYAAGRLLRTLFMARDRVSLPQGTTEASAPLIALRGHQIGYRPKTNSYDGWTLGMWEQYYRDMIIFGTNAVELIPPRSDDDLDSPHFPRQQLAMMAGMSQLAKDYGLDVWIWFPAIDEDYTNEETVKAALDEWGEVFRKLPKVDAVFVPGGDPGNTHPAVLLHFMERQKRNLNQYHPKAQMWVSPQGFDRPGKNRDGWMGIFLDILKSDEPEWLDGVVFGPQVEMSLSELREAVPAKYPIRRYPDITHSGGGQYEVPDWDSAFDDTLGREPINPRPYAYARIFREIMPYAIGTITYSEGCNDDVNKVIWSSLGWDPNRDVETILREYSRYFIGRRFEDAFTEGLVGLEENWAGPLAQNDVVYETLKRFQEMEKWATPREKLNWRFQQGLYRAYYDAYIKARVHYETELEKEAIEVLGKAPELGSLNAMDRAEAIYERAVTERVRPEWRARAFELAEALFQSIRMQLSVWKYQAIRLNRGANLDSIDEALNERKRIVRRFVLLRKLGSEEERLGGIAKIVESLK